MGYHTKTKDKIPLCNPVGTMIADVDNDGDMDIVGSTIGLNYVGGYLITYLNDGDGNFSIFWQHSIHSVTKFNFKKIGQSLKLVMMKMVVSLNTSTRC